MTRTPRPQLAVAVSAAALALTMVVGCSDGTDDREPTTTTPLAPAQQWDPNQAPATTEPTAPTAATTLPDTVGQVDRSDPAQLAQTAVQIWFSWDTAADTGPNDAAARTAPLLTQTFADSLLSSGSNSPGGQWLSWAAKDAIITPAITPMPDQGAPQTSDRKYFVFQVVQTAHTPSGEQVGTPVTTSAWVICVRSGDHWEVSQLAQR